MREAPALWGLGLFGWLILLAAGATATVLARRVRIWRRGVSSPTRVTAWNLLSVPRRYLVDLHRVVGRDKLSARMHMFAAGGFLLGLTVTAAGEVTVIRSMLGAWFALVQLAAAGMVLCGVFYAAARRSPFGPASRTGRLSQGAYRVLAPSLAAFAAFVAAAAVLAMGPDPAAVASGLDFVLVAGAAVAGAFALRHLLLGMGDGPMRHAFAGALHLAWHPRPERFEPARPATALRTLPEPCPKLGVELAHEFTWIQRLSFDACVQCGRCQEACPAFAAGAPLNPKKLIFDLWQASDERNARVPYAGQPHPAAPGAQPALTAMAGFVDPNTLWACTTCRACVQACPMMLEHVDAVIDMRRYLTMEQGATPALGGRIWEPLATTGNLGGASPALRTAFASGLGLPLAHDMHRPFDVLLWLGEGAFEPRAQRSLRAFIELLHLARVDFAVLGEAEADVGDVARRLGDEDTFTSLAQRNIATLSQHRFKRIVSLDPHVVHCLGREYPELGGVFDVWHHSRLLNQLIGEDRLPVAAIEGVSLTYHDPCYLGRYLGEFDAPRSVLFSLAVAIREMDRNRGNSFCCGAGGGAAMTDVPSARRIPDLRIEQARATGAAAIAVACPCCTVMLEGVSGQRPEIIELSELVLQAAKLATAGGIRA